MTALRSFPLSCSRQQRLFLILAATPTFATGKMLRQKTSVCKQIAYEPTNAWATPKNADQAQDQIKADGLDAVMVNPLKLDKLQWRKLFDSGEHFTVEQMISENYQEGDDNCSDSPSPRFDHILCDLETGLGPRIGTIWPGVEIQMPDGSSVCVWRAARPTGSTANQGELKATRTCEGVKQTIDFSVGSWASLNLKDATLVDAASGQPKPFTPKLCVPAPTTTTPAPPTTTPAPPTTTPEPPTTTTPAPLTTTPAPLTTTPAPPTTTPKPRSVRQHKVVKNVVNQIETEEGSLAGFSCC